MDTYGTWRGHTEHRRGVAPARRTGAQENRSFATTAPAWPTQPSLSAHMVQALLLTGVERVLEIGTGYGYQTFLLARLASFVTSVERWPDLAAQALRNLAGQTIDNVSVVVGDGTEGVPAQAPYDAVLVSAAFPEVPRPLVDQLRPGGRLVQPIGPGGAEQVILFERLGAELERRELLCPASFVRLYGRHGYPCP